MRGRRAHHHRRTQNRGTTPAHAGKTELDIVARRVDGDHPRACGEDNYRTVTTLPFNLDTSQVTNMFCMFFDCSSLTQVPDLDTSQVTNMSYMFYGCSSLTDGKVRLIRKDGTKPRYRDDMIIDSGLTREPFFKPDGTPIN